MCIDDITGEMALSLSLIFCRNAKSRHIASRFIQSQDNLNLDHELLKFHKNYKRHPELQDFTVFRPHLALLQQRMRDWKPRTFSELTCPAYYDRFGWYTAIFGVVFGVLGALSLIVSGIQLAYAIVAINLARRSIELQLQQMGMTTGN